MCRAFLLRFPWGGTWFRSVGWGGSVFRPGRLSCLVAALGLRGLLSLASVTRWLLGVLHGRFAGGGFPSSYIYCRTLLLCCEGAFRARPLCYLCIYREWLILCAVRGDPACLVWLSSSCTHLADRAVPVRYFGEWAHALRVIHPMADSASVWGYHD